MMPEFIAGLELSERYFAEVVEPILAEVAPDLRYVAGRIGPGSDVIGLDTARSMDHDWGPRVTIWLGEDERAARHHDLRAAIGERLPATFLGFPTRYGVHDDGTLHMASEDAVAHGHNVTISAVRQWFGGGDREDPETAAWIRLPDAAIDAAIAGEPIDLAPAIWVTLPMQWLLESTAGRIFRDDQGAMSRLRSALAWYPDDVWRYLMAAQWRRLDQLEPFVGRCGEVGDDLGSQLVAFSQIRDVMRLAFLQECRYAPYAKWLGTAFARLEAAPVLQPWLDEVRHARTWQEREAALVNAVQWLGERQNAMGIAEWVDATPRSFHDRPFQVLFAGRFGDALMRAVTDPAVHALPPHIGGIDQITDSTDVIGRGDFQRAIGEWMMAATGT
jgi:hypothetical protein